LFLSAMGSYADRLRESGSDVHDARLPDTGANRDPEEKLRAYVDAERIERIDSFEIEDKFLEERVRRFVERLGFSGIVPARRCSGPPATSFVHFSFRSPRRTGARRSSRQRSFRPLSKSAPSTTGFWRCASGSLRRGGAVSFGPDQRTQVPCVSRTVVFVLAPVLR
jgi:hypothetical protein